MPHFNTRIVDTLITLIIVICITLISGFAFANGGPAYYDPRYQGQLTFDMDSGIELFQEDLKLIIEQGSRNELIGDYEVTYYLSNTTSQKKEIELLFLIPPYYSEYIPPDNILVYEGHRRIAYEWLGSVHVKNWQATNGEQGYIQDPFTKRQLKRLSDTDVHGILFTLSFDSNERKQINFLLHSPHGQISKGVVSPVFSHTYLLTPAHTWSGNSILNLTVEAPVGVQLHSNLPLSKVEQEVGANTQRYVSKLDHLPNEEWVVSAAYKQHAIFMTNKTFTHNVLSILFAVLVVLIGYYVFLPKGLLSQIGTILLGLAIYMYLVREIVGYPFDVLVLPFSYILFVVGFLVVFNRQRIKQARRKDYLAHKHLGGNEHVKG